MENKIFKYALITSVVVHIFVLVTLWLTNIQFGRIEEKAVMEIVYRIPAERGAIDNARQEMQLQRLRKEKKVDLPGTMPKQENFDHQPGPAPQKAPVRLEIPPQKAAVRLYESGEKRQIRIPMLDSDQMMGSRYVTYHEQVRNKIRDRAYFYVDDPRFETGEVYLTFVLGSDGRLKQAQISDDRTSANHYLRDVGLRSIRESSPFPSFPKDLDYPELTFHVVISFEIGE